MLPSMDEPRVLHVDPQLLVVDKPAGLLSVPGRGEGELFNLTVQLQRTYPDAQVVHRLDQATSGESFDAGRGAGQEKGEKQREGLDGARHEAFENTLNFSEQKV